MRDRAGYIWRTGRTRPATGVESWIFLILTVLVDSKEDRMAGNLRAELALLLPSLLQFA